MKIISFVVGLSLATTAVIAFADAASSATPPAVYQPTYQYGETPMGAYMGDPYEGDDMMGDDMYVPDGEPMHEYQTQSGEQEQQFQYIQGQEQLMRTNSQEKLQQFNDSRQLTESMDKQYLVQIESKTDQSAPAPIVLPNM